MFVCGRHYLKNRPAMSSDYKRRGVHYSGRVQGVGFRYTVRSISQRYAVTGYVQNLDDGRVRLEVEGPSDQIDAFLAEIASTMQRYIHAAAVVASSATGEFSDFSIRPATN